ncbi:two-component system, OmpR family, sensor histidine kinase CssS [Anaerovirgula multivorans]|uniref:histidine kinase n=1 Tax=Anaerovirgula multivorans TaxID=312168 RepID=A0A239EJ07_9FIRM|nr:HAMP domain-containing sensor histidine kinase [Anaerovirgula multivorans]SNS44626.1 two-component system, OmpR family, sensor histidine kinase CssS [Anaerovirgula multivorans]
MKNLPLSLQIWLVIAVITLSISLFLSILFPLTLRSFFTTEIYATIENAQNLFVTRYDTEFSRDNWQEGFSQERRPPMQDVRTVNHLILVNDNQLLGTGGRLPTAFIETVGQQSEEQLTDSERYSIKIEERKIFYIIRKVSIWGNEVILVSHMWDTYRDDLVQTLFNKLGLIMGVVFLFSWIPALLLAKYLSSPLVALEKRVGKIANRDWQEPLQLKRKDEIGKLGTSIEQLREQLLRQDEAQQSFLQHISHELKTPVMVIRSYVQSIRDGIYPKGDLTNTLEVIEEEAECLEKRIRNLLYLTKLDYMETHKPQHQSFDIGELIKEVVERLRWQRSELDWHQKLTQIEVIGDIEQWRVALENLLDNQIRYAKEKIVISLTQKKKDNQGLVKIHIWNDGPPIEEATMKNLFHQYGKGYKGEFGLGLAIVYRIATIHEAKVWAENQEDGVSFYLEIPI